MGWTHQQDCIQSLQLLIYYNHSSRRKKNRHTTIASPVRHSSEGGIKEMETETNTDPARCEPRRAATGQRRPQPTLLSRPQGQGGRLAGGYPA
jgi:hypothetical protein